MLIGLIGKNAAGKTTVAEYLKSKGFYYYSLSDILREEAQRSGIFPTRGNMIKLGNELRKRFGPGILATMALEKIKFDRNYVVDSIRNPEEARVLKRQAQAQLFFIDAPEKVRFERLKARARPGDPRTFEEFLSLEEKEAQNSDDAMQNIEATILLADKKIENNSTLQALYKKVDSALETEKTTAPAFERPEWDQYFIDVAKTVATRSNCIKRKVAAVIVKEKRIISTGYNGTPRGVKNCNEGGCARCNSFAESGTKLDECVCSHGEENAIVQASYHGVPIKDSTLYTTFSPCLMCAKMIINAGIKRVVYNEEYPLNETTSRILREAKIELVQHRF